MQDHDIVAIKGSKLYLCFIQCYCMELHRKKKKECLARMFSEIKTSVWPLRAIMYTNM